MRMRTVLLALAAALVFAAVVAFIAYTTADQEQNGEPFDVRERGTPP